MSKRILVALSTFAKHGDEPLKILRESALPYFINPLGKRLVQNELIEMGNGCEGIIAGLEPYDDYVLDNLLTLRCISRCGVGVDNISLKKAKERGIEIRTTPETVAQPVAELVVAMAFDLLKRLSLHTALLKSGRWEKHTGNLIKGKKVGIIGLGRIGKRTAELFRGLGQEVYGSDISPDHGWASRAGVRIVSTEELLRISDLVTIHISRVENRPFTIGRREIGIMKRGAMLINTGRGNFVDEEELYAALKERRLAGAALDAFSEEPYFGKLRDLDNVILTPHIGTLTEESRLEMEILAVKNLVDFFTC